MAMVCRPRTLWRRFLARSTQRLTLGLVVLAAKDLTVGTAKRRYRDSLAAVINIYEYYGPVMSCRTGFSVSGVSGVFQSTGTDVVPTRDSMSRATGIGSGGLDSGNTVGNIQRDGTIAARPEVGNRVITPAWPGHGAG